MKNGYGNPYEVHKSQPLFGNYKNEKVNYHFVQEEEQLIQDLAKERGRKKFPNKQSEIKQSNIFSTPQDPLYFFSFFISFQK